MRRLSFCLIAVMVMCSMIRAQSDKPPAQQPPEESKPRPTLGPPTPSSPHGPRSSTTTDVRKLVRIKKLFIQSMDNMLSDKLVEAIGKAGRFQIVAEAKEADAVMRGSCFESRRLKSLHSEVFLTDQLTGASIWQDNLVRPFNPPVLQKAVDDTANLITQHLNDDVEQAQRK